RSVDVFLAIEEIAGTRLSFKLLTMLLLSPDGEEVRRLYTTDPVNYPVSGREKLGRTEWGKHVLGRIHIQRIQSMTAARCMKARKYTVRLS
ncbi:MAG: hypothetical protein ACREEG_17340, partial [Phenylobacterium sp.]